MQNLKKFREYILKLSIGNGEHGRTDGQTDGRTDGRTDRRTDTEGYNIIPRHTLVAGYKKIIYNTIPWACYQQ